MHYIVVKCIVVVRVCVGRWHGDLHRAMAETSDPFLPHGTLRTIEFLTVYFPAIMVILIQSIPFK